MTVDFFDAFSSCWWLSQTCLPKWEAWSVAAGVAAVVTTAILGFVTYRLGKAANRASAVAVKIASSQAEKQAYRDESERLLVLMQITAEVSSNAGLLSHLLGLLNHPGCEVAFVSNKSYQDRIFGRLNKLSFPSTEQVKDRLHYLDRATGASLVRAVGMFQLLQSSDRHRDGTETEDELRAGLSAMRATIPLIVADLQRVEAECVAAVHRLGLNKEQL
ncbi:hypothetical protein [Stenotrophomonas rhizophila]